MANTIVMKAPANVTTMTATGPLNTGQTYTVDSSGFVTVDPRDVPELVRAGFTVGSGAQRNNLAAVTDPGATNDTTQDYSVGSVWVNLSGGRVWLCLSATASLAAWLLLSAPANNPRNMIDGGDATTNPWQLGTSFNGTNTAKLVADRFAAVGGAATTWLFSKQANSDVQGFSQAFRWGRSAGVTATLGLTFGQVFESIDSIRAQGLPVQMSFWNKCGANFSAGASAGVFVASLIAGTGVDDTFANMVAGSWTGASTVATVTVTPSTSAAQRYGVHTNAGFGGTVPTNATQLGWVVNYQPSGGTTAGANEWLEFLGIGVEVGQGGLGIYEHTDVAEVLNICQRYLFVVSEPTVAVQVGAGVATAASLAAINIPTPVTMRKAPTLTFTAGGYAITDGAGAAHTVSGAGAATNTTPNVVGLNLTAATTLTAGHAAILIGRTTGNGVIIANSDYANP